MKPLFDAPVAMFLATDPARIADALNGAATRHYLTTEAAQLRAWEASIRVLQAALGDAPAAHAGHVLLELPLLRLQKRIDAVVLTDRAILVIEFKVGSQAYANADQAQVEDYAMDLHEFHAGSRRHPVVPILVATDAPATRFAPPLIWHHVVPTLRTNAAGLGAILRGIHAGIPPPAEPLDAAAWMHAPYRPVPNVIEAAAMLYHRNAVGDLAEARAEAGNLRTTTQAIAGAIARACAAGQRIVVFVTGIPGAGKTLCGLNAVFGTPVADRATYLTGNPTLVHVLREGLARDAAAGRRAALALARRQTHARIQALPAFRDHHVATGETPDERVIVVDEAQRSWNAAQAVRKTAGRAVRLTQSEAGHLLDAMARHAGWCAIVCLVGGGQEIHDGEGGLREWAMALADRPDWHVVASPVVLQADDPRQRLDAVPIARLMFDPALHLDVAVRSIRGPQAARWVDAVLQGDAMRARDIAAQGTLPFLLTRALPDLRAGLKARARGLRRSGLVCSAGARRLRAEGLGVELPHMDADAVADWFLDRWPDVRASDALEVCATEFSCQGLELDYVGLAWGGDLVRGHGGWKVRRFRGTAWVHPAGAETVANQVNTYRVLLTRARYETIIWVPQGDDADVTRPRAEMDAIADFLLACGARPLALAEGPADATAPRLL